MTLEVLTPVVDSYGRPIHSMRISLTSRCNFDCIYCHKEGILDSEHVEMSPEEIETLVRMGSRRGIKKIKFTGGEPLLRPDIVEIVGRVAKIPGIKDVSLTTNAYYLEGFARDLKEAGLDRVNISLDTIKPETFKKITRLGNLDKVMRGIDRAVEVGLVPVKLNMVVMDGINVDEIQDILERFPGDKVVLQLIELMDADHELFEKYFFDLDPVEEEFKKSAEKTWKRHRMQGRTQYMLDGHKIEFVKPMHNTEFCRNCTRIRVTADGKFKPCLMRTDNMVDFLKPMREEGIDDKGLEKIYLKAARKREPYFKP